MKRVLMALLFVVAMLASITCYAQITVADLNIGGIYYGMPEAEVIEKLGKPIRMYQTRPQRTDPVFKCGNAEILVGCSGKSHTVYSVDILSGDGVYTAAGIGIGSSYEDVIKTYGQANHDTILENPTTQIYTVQYMIKNIAEYSNGFLEFGFDSDKKVKRISFYEYGY